MHLGVKVKVFPNHTFTMDGRCGIIPNQTLFWSKPHIYRAFNPNTPSMKILFTPPKLPIPLISPQVTLLTMVGISALCLLLTMAVSAISPGSTAASVLQIATAVIIVTWSCIIYFTTRRRRCCKHHCRCGEDTLDLDAPTERQYPEGLELPPLEPGARL